ncbi:uncharacterized protein LOC143447372 isoform X3 [Clavelina lepadiformis]|uniref:uncharacterized protein LOC143447372 isoform X3 n=1 Tax=Clavelina lepadiformis TaxID=159417 RepID=UPI0040431792
MKSVFVVLIIYVWMFEATSNSITTIPPIDDSDVIASGVQPFIVSAAFNRTPFSEHCRWDDNMPFINFSFSSPCQFVANSVKGIEIDCDYDAASSWVSTNLTFYNPLPVGPLTIFLHCDGRSVVVLALTVATCDVDSSSYPGVVVNCPGPCGFNATGTLSCQDGYKENEKEVHCLLNGTFSDNLECQPIGDPPSAGLIIGISIGCLALVIAISVAFYCFIEKIQRRINPADGQHGERKDHSHVVAHHNGEEKVKFEKKERIAMDANALEGNGKLRLPPLQKPPLLPPANAIAGNLPNNQPPSPGIPPNGGAEPNAQIARQGFSSVNAAETDKAYSLEQDDQTNAGYDANDATTMVQDGGPNQSFSTSSLIVDQDLPRTSRAEELDCYCKTVFNRVDADDAAVVYSIIKESAGVQTAQNDTGVSNEGNVARTVNTTSLVAVNVQPNLVVSNKPNAVKGLKKSSHVEAVSQKDNKTESIKLSTEKQAYQTDVVTLGSIEPNISSKSSSASSKEPQALASTTVKNLNPEVHPRVEKSGRRNVKVGQKRQKRKGKHTKKKKKKTTMNKVTPEP